MWANGMKYDGMFKDGVMDGQGVLLNTKGKGRFEGIS